MNFLELVKKRYSVRDYDARPIEKEKIKYVLDAGRLAPSAGNRQPWFFIVAQQDEFKNKIIDTYNVYPNFINNIPPAVIVICGNHRASWRRRDGKDHCDIDVAIAVDHMMLAAAELDLGTCWIGGFDSMLCHKVLNIPLHIEVIAMLTIGYPSVDKKERIIKKRKTFDEIVFWDQSPNIQ